MRYRYFSSFSKQELSSRTKSLQTYRLRLQKISKEKKYAYPESSLSLPDDNKLYATVRTCLRATVSPRLRTIIVVGIGGSNLGVKAVYDAFQARRYGTSDRFPKLFFADTLSGEWIEALCAICSDIQDPAELLIVIATKSGTTTETIAIAETLLSSLSDTQRFSKRIVAITDKESPLWQRSIRNGWHTLEIPTLVGGRFSVLSPVGLFPLAAVGINIRALRQGAHAMREAALQQSLKRNPALQSALHLYLTYQQGFIVHDTFLFAPELESLGKWYRQLLGESIGKEYDVRGKVVHAGIIPTVSIGSTDLHSVAQLYLGGPKKIVTTFVRVARSSKLRVPHKSPIHGLVNGIESKKLSDILDALLDGTQIAYRKAALPFAECILDSISEKELGAFMQWKMMEVMYLGNCIGVNAFDQPNVEQYKREARKKLGQ